MKKIRKAKIKQNVKGISAGQWRFTLYGDNGKVVGVGELYHNKKDMLFTLTEYFPDFKIVEG